MVDRRTVEDRSFLADGLVGSTPSIVYGTGRVCIESSCTVQLSRYNSTEWCALHESPASTQRPYDTSTRQPRGRRRNSRRRVSVPQAQVGDATAAHTAAAHTAAAQTAAAQSARTQSARTQPGRTERTADAGEAAGKAAAKSNRENAA